MFFDAVTNNDSRTGTTTNYNMADQVDSVELTQQISDLLDCQGDKHKPPVPQHIASRADDENPFLAFEISTTWRTWIDTTY